VVVQYIHDQADRFFLHDNFICLLSMLFQKKMCDGESAKIDILQE